MVSNNFPKGTEVDLKIPMVPDMELAAAKTAEAMAEYAHFSDDEIEEIKMAIIETCINAFEHSESMDRNVYISFHVDKKRWLLRLWIRVRVSLKKMLKHLILRKRSMLNINEAGECSSLNH